jgi:ABC-type bacteriocin/lantibiotic exporter with double-glycine peptidase domain
VDRKNAEIKTKNNNTSNNDNDTATTTTTEATDAIREPTKMKPINLKNLFKTVNDYIRMVTMLLISLIPLLLLGVVLFGDNFFLGNVVVYNIQQLLDSMAGFVGIVTLLLIVYFYTRIEHKKN